MIKARWSGRWGEFWARVTITNHNASTGEFTVQRTANAEEKIIKRCDLIDTVNGVEILAAMALFMPDRQLDQEHGDQQ